jgi:hypothetical protein
MSAIEDAGKPPFSLVPQKFFSPFPHISKTTSVNVGQRSGQQSLRCITARQVGREDASTARVRELDVRNVPSQISATSVKAMPNPILTTCPGSGLGTSSPAGADIQGPSPVDYSLEIEAKFPVKMVIEMRGNAVQKARRTVIGWTLGGRTTFKALYECLKLHLPVPFTSATFLTRGYFLILFENEEGAISTRKLTMVEWSELSLSFSRYTRNFDASAQGAKALLTHTVKVQFPDLHEQFQNVKALTIMASKLGEGKILEGPPTLDTHPLTNPNGQPSLHPLPQVGSRQRKKGTQQKAPVAPLLGMSNKAWAGPSHPAKTPRPDQA